jgi:hypothetical protein
MSQDYPTKAAEAARKAADYDDKGNMAKAKEAYLIAIEYLNMAKRQYGKDANCKDLIQQ